MPHFLGLFKELLQEEVHEEIRKLLQERDLDLESLLCRLMEEEQLQTQTAEETTNEESEEKPLIEVIDKMPAEDEKNAEEDSIRSAKKRHPV